MSSSPTPKTEAELRPLCGHLIGPGLTCALPKGHKCRAHMDENHGIVMDEKLVVDLLRRPIRRGGYT